MRSSTTIAIFGMALALASQSTIACDSLTGKRTQRVALMSSGSLLEMWTPDSSSIKSVDLPNGFHLGIRVEPASAEKYVELSKSLAHVPEMVKVELYDMSSTNPRLITHTWAGSNSIQGYGAEGGADRVEQLGSPGIDLILLKSVCAPAASP